MADLEVPQPFLQPAIIAGEVAVGSGSEVMNQISGEGILPAVLAGAGRCGELEVLSLACNSISGAVPPSTFTGCDAMEHLDLSDNWLAGELEAQVAGCGNLTFLSFAGNEFSGEIKAAPNLKQLNLSYNNFVGDSPGSWFRLADLETLDFRCFEWDFRVFG